MSAYTDTNTAGVIECVCGKCGLPIHPHENRRHFGWHVAHDEYRCLELLKAEVARLREALATAELLRQRVTKTSRPPLQLDVGEEVP